MNSHMHIYYDKEGDYLEIRFGEPTESTYEKIGSDTFVRVDRKTKEVKGYAVYNVRKGSGASIDIEIPIDLFKSLKNEKISS
ncbi:MAG TPA: hypothetical protein VJK51_01885 [Candidatus Nanoarchaeia archaeon]|nr:hypothetical protein [Candidatus Nanoarchaeia archaeon]